MPIHVERHRIPGLDPAISRIRNSRLWRDRVRPQQLRDFPYCIACDKVKRLREATQVDHIKPLSEGGAPYEPSNLQSLCASCHAVKTAKENRERNKVGVVY